MRESWIVLPTVATELLLATWLADDVTRGATHQGPARHGLGLP